MKKLLVSAAIAALATSVLAHEHGGVVRIGTEGAYPPWNIINDAGEVDGFERELGDMLCERAELTCEWVTNDWDSIIPNLVSGNYDAIMAGMSITDERDAVIDFTQAYTPPDPSTYLALSEDVDFETAVVAVQTGTIHAGYVAESGATMVEFPVPDAAVAAILNGEADVLFADKSFADTALETNSELMEVGEPVLLGGGVGMGFRESDAELREKFNTAIAEMKEDGSLNELIEKWEVSSQW